MSVKKKKTGYTPQEVGVIIKHVRSNANNLTHAFELSAQELGKTVGAISGYYYQKLKNNPDNKVMVLATSRGMMVNTKNSPRRQAVDQLSPMMETMNFMASKLTKAEKQQLIKTLVDAC